MCGGRGGKGREGRIAIERNQLGSVWEVSRCMVQVTQEVCSVTQEVHSASNTGST